jgi:hypothetical protein
MKHVCCLFIVFSGIAGAQDVQQLFQGSKLVWCGMDFTRSRMIGVKDVKPDVIVNEYLERWNQAVLYETDNFPLGTFFKKVDVYYDVQAVNTRNKTAEVATLFNENTIPYSRPEIESIIKSLKLNRKEGLGLIVFVDYFNKKKAEASFQLAFFDVATQKLVLVKRMNGIAQGMGLKAYWAGALADAFRKIMKNDLMKIWEEEAISGKY